MQIPKNKYQIPILTCVYVPSGLEFGICFLEFLKFAVSRNLRNYYNTELMNPYKLCKN